MTKNLPRLALAAVLLAGSLRVAAAETGPDKYRPAPVSVSSLNYRDISRDEQIRLDAEKMKTNPVSRSVRPLAKPQRYVFIPGELYENDLPYDEICRRLTAALAKKGFVNATDDAGRVIAPNEVDLVLRVNAGERPWRRPSVRINSLTWRDGLVERPRGRSLTTLGGDVMWENRAGGNDDALGAAATNENARGFGYGSSAGTPAGASPLNSTSAVNTRTGSDEYEATREFYLLVVDAFSYEELRKDGPNAKRLWTTFLAAPRQHGEKFSDVLNTLLRVGTPYFGETTEGLQMFNDARANVTPGELRVIESDVKNPESPR
ncbi:MAG TPA: hypothetical protein VK477_07285 [Acidobacteriota bacterium]|nr:hypothetical protein [Acidobacteriota bacterium]